MIPLPKELPELRDRQIGYLRSPLARAFLGDGIDYDNPRSAGETASREADTWTAAHLFHIAPSMVDLVMQAKDGIGDAGFMPYDLPASVGIAVFGASLGSKRIKPLPYEFTEEEFDALASDPDGGDIDLDGLRRYQATEWDELLAVSWSDEPPSDGAPNGRLRMTWWHERDSWIEAYRSKRTLFDKARREAHEINSIRDKVGDYVPVGISSIAYGDDSTQVRVVHDETVLAADERADMFRALCYLLRQRIAEETVVLPDRAARRRMARVGKEPGPVRLISIRGASASGGGDGTREYVHRWIVRGHWRRQWYRSIQSHRPIWITPYVKGPEDAPLLGGQKVYVASAPARWDGVAFPAALLGLAAMALAGLMEMAGVGAGRYSA